MQQEWKLENATSRSTVLISFVPLETFTLEENVQDF